MLAIILSLPFLLPVSTALHVPRSSHNVSDYSHAHLYNPAYAFHKRDGWDTVSISDLAYKYGQGTRSTDVSTRRGLERRSRKPQRKNSIGGAIQHVVDATLKGIGKIEQVKITWYTGNDLKNPSCWKKSVWAPTDESFACAVTLEGWTNRPKCFNFIELCNNRGKCIFVRVVDTCAGCAKGSKHVDLTKAAFKALATLDQGALQVRMRLATEPKEWHENLWGPRKV